MTLPSGARIERDHAPPGRTSIRPEIGVKPRGPHQRARCSGLVHILKTRWRGASKIRVMTSSRTTERAGASAAIAIFPLPALQLAEIVIEAIKAVVPKTAIVIEPMGGVLKRRWPDPTGPPLRLTAPCN